VPDGWEILFVADSHMMLLLLCHLKMNLYVKSDPGGAVSLWPKTHVNELVQVPSSSATGSFCFFVALREFRD